MTLLSIGRSCVFYVVSRCGQLGCICSQQLFPGTQCVTIAMYVVVVPYSSAWSKPLVGAGRLPLSKRGKYVLRRSTTLIVPKTKTNGRVDGGSRTGTRTGTEKGSGRCEICCHCYCYCHCLCHRRCHPLAPHSSPLTLLFQRTCQFSPSPHPVSSKFFVASIRPFRRCPRVCLSRPLSPLVFQRHKVTTGPPAIHFIPPQIVSTHRHPHILNDLPPPATVAS